MRYSERGVRMNRNYPFLCAFYQYLIRKNVSLYLLHLLQTALGGRQNIGGYACFLDLARIRASSLQDSEPFCQFCLLSRYYIVFQVTHSPCPSALFRLHSSFVLEAIKCTVLFSICFHRLLRYYDCVGLPAIHLDS